jgi:hypothetical protein
MKNRDSREDFLALSAPYRAHFAEVKGREERK